ncbi:MAG: uracil-xanthine permease family protein [Bacilli bacterium]|jgi:uracil permease
MDKKLLFDYNEKPKKGLWLLLSFQHVFAMFSATVLVPMLTGLPISVALFSSGVGTLIYILCTKGKVPIYLGSSFAYISYIIAAAAMTGDFGAALTGIVIVGIIYCIVALVIKLVGTGWLKKLLPPIVIGPMIMVIGLSLSSVAVAQSGLIEGGSWYSIVVAVFTMLVVAFLAIRAKGFFQVIPFLLGIVAGYILSLIVYFCGGQGLFMNGDVNLLEGFVNVAKDPAQWFSLPKFVFLGFENRDIGLGLSVVKFNFAATVSVIPLAFATISEHLGDHQVLGRITGKDYMVDPGLHRTLLGDGLATSFAGLIGGPANTSYGENTSVVGITRVGSVWVTGGAAVIAILLSFFNLFDTLIGTIPGPVMGGVCLILYGFIAANGLKTLVDSKVDMTETRNLIIISVMLVIGLGGAVIMIGSQGKFSTAALSMIVGIILNAILPHSKNGAFDK